MHIYPDILPKVLLERFNPALFWLCPPFIRCCFRGKNCTNKHQTKDTSQKRKFPVHSAAVKQSFLKVSGLSSVFMRMRDDKPA